jgi:hypothetical protein
MQCPICGGHVELDQPVCGTCGAKLPKVGPPNTALGLAEDAGQTLLWYGRLSLYAVVLLVLLFIHAWQIAVPVLLAGILVAFLLSRERGPKPLDLND